MSSRVLAPALSPLFVRVFSAADSGLERSRGRRFAEAAISCIVGTLALFAIMAVFRHLPLANEATVGLVFLLAVLITAAISGYATSLSVAVTATLLYNYFFIPPVNTWNVADYRDWVTLGVFLLTAVVGSTLSYVAKREAERARRQRREAEQLYELSQRLSTSGSALAVCRATPQDIVETFGSRAAAIFIAEEQRVFCSREGAQEFDVLQFKTSMTDRSLRVDSVHRISYVPLRLGTGIIGSAAIRETPLSPATLDALGALIAMAIERARMIEQLAKMEALREREGLKTVLVDTIVHEFRTPLTAVKASAILLRDNLDGDREQRQECISIINEGCDAIDQLVEEISQMSRLESRDVNLELARHSIGELVDAALSESWESLGSRPLQRQTADEETLVKVDLFWATKILKHLLANAALYSKPGTAIVIRTEAKNGFAYFHVADQGPGIEAEEVGRIFEKFYRGKEHRCRVHGTGMGLPIAKAITEAHGGTMTLVSSIGEGSVFSFSLPIDRSFRCTRVIHFGEEETATMPAGSSL